MFRISLSKWFASQRRVTKKTKRLTRLLVERLEERCVPSTFVVNELGDTHAANLVSGVDSTGQVSLRSAIEAANHLGGDQTIQFDATLFATPQTIALTLGQLTLNDTTKGATLSIDGPCPGVTINARHASRVFVVTAATHAELRGLTITNGQMTGDGGGIYNAGVLTLNESTVSGNTVVWFPSGPYASPMASGRGGGIFNAGRLTINASTISGNLATWGGGIYNMKTLTVNNSTICKNAVTPLWYGGYPRGSSGGGLANSGIATLTCSTISANRAPGVPNAPTSCGGGVWNLSSATVTLNDCTLTGNVSAAGGGVENSYGTATLRNSTLTHNTARIAGGGLYDYGGTSTLVNCTISGNSAGEGGGIVGTNYWDPITLIGCTVSGNTAAGQGGGISMFDCDVTLDNSTVAGNTSGSNGGGIYNLVGTLTLNNSTISGNIAAGAGGGLYNLCAATTLNNTLVAGNRSSTTARDISGPISVPYGGLPSRNNLIGDGTGMTGLANNSNGNRVGTRSAPINPLLAPLGNYGGLTQTMALLPGSPAIDAGNNALIPAGITTDQRGDPRIVNGRVDIGAFESSGFTIQVVCGDNQCAPLNSTFSEYLVAEITANDPCEPVAGGVVTVRTPSCGPAATMPSHATIGADGTVRLMATPSGVASGPYDVTIGVTGIPACGDAVFHLTNDAVDPRLDHLAFVSQPTDITAGQLFCPIVVQVEDSCGNLVSDAGGMITLTLQGGTAATTITAPVIDGVATFDNATVNAMGCHTFSASDGAITPAASSRFLVSFSDSFATASPSTTFWKTVTGGFTDSNHQAVGRTGLSEAFLTGVAEKNVRVSADIGVAHAGQNAGLIARYSGPSDSNMYLATIVNQNGIYSARIFRNLHGTWTVLASTTLIGFSGTGHLEFDVIGSSLRLFLNSSLTLATTDSTIAGPGSVGMRGANGESFSNFNASTVVLQSADGIFSDGFASTTDGQLSNVWLDQSGDFITDGTHAIGQGSRNTAVVNGFAQANVQVSAAVSLPGTGMSAGLVARYSGPGDNNLYLGQIVNSHGTYTASVYRSLHGVWTLLASKTLTSAQFNGSGQLEFDAIGSSLRLLVNGTLTIATDDNAITTAGSVGIRGSAGAMLGNFNAGTVTFQTAHGTFDDSFAATTNGCLNNYWVGVAGDFLVSATGITASCNGPNLALLYGVASADVSESVQIVNLLSGQTAGLVARYQSTGNGGSYYFAALSRSSTGYTATIYKCVGGVFTVLARATLSPALFNGTGTIEFDVIGSSLHLSVMNGENAVVVAKATDTSIAGPGTAGIRGSAQTQFTNYHADLGA